MNEIAESMGILTTVVLMSLFIIWATRLFNRLIKLRTLCEEGWGGVTAALKRKRDLTFRLVEAAERYVTLEPEALRNFIQARALGQAAKSVAEAAHAEASLTAALAGLKGILENNPALGADEDVLHIRKELPGLEARIEKTRRYYNATARDQNMEMDRFPAKLVVGLMGFERAAFFETYDAPAEDSRT